MDNAIQLLNNWGQCLAKSPSFYLGHAFCSPLGLSGYLSKKSEDTGYIRGVFDSIYARFPFLSRVHRLISQTAVGNQA